MNCLRNKYNPNLYRYRNQDIKDRHQAIMDENGYEVYHEWEEKGLGNRIYFYCEYKEISKA